MASDAVDEPTDRDVSVSGWLVAAIAVLGLVLLVAFARREAGFDDRVPDPADATAVIVVTSSGGGSEHDG